MAEVVKVSETWERVEQISHKTNGCAAMPQTLDGLPQFGLLKRATEDTYGQTAGREVMLAAQRDYALSTGDRDLYKRARSASSPRQPNTSFFFDYDFLPQKDTPPHAVTSRSADEHIAFLLDWIKKRTDGASLYAPFFRQPVEGAQVEVTGEVKNLIASIESGAKVKTLEEPQDGLCVATAPMMALPTYVPFSPKKGDYDSSDCNLDLFSATGRGDKVKILATRGEFVLIQTDYSFGWVLKKHVVTPKTPIRDSQTVYYSGDDAVFVNTKAGVQVVLPGDRLLEREHSLFLAYSNGDDVGFNGINSLGLRTTKQMKDAQKVYDFLTRIKVPYLWGKFDCSGVSQRIFRMMGLPPIGKYSRDIFDSLVDRFGNHIDVTPETIRQMTDGLYLLDLMAGTSSVHLYFDFVKAGKHFVLSQAFQITGDTGLETPVGIHECTEKGLLAQMLEKKRTIEAVKIAKPKERVPFTSPYNELSQRDRSNF